MLQSRRGFLAGLGNLLTGAFIADAEAFVRETCRPLLTPPPEVRQTLYWYLPDGSDAPAMCLDASPHLPPPPTWREFLNLGFARLSNPATPENIEIWRQYYGAAPDELDLPMDAVTWQRDFDFLSGPRARAASLLAGIHFGEELDRFPHDRRPHIHLQAARIGNNHFTRWVTASDMLALSLLQARLIDLKRPIKIEQWKGNSGPASAGVPQRHGYLRGGEATDRLL